MVDVYTNDANLVFLYRFRNFATDQQLFNETESSVYMGLNSCQISGTPTTDSNKPTACSGGSGVKFEGAGDIFHLHMTSGNQSGIETQSGSVFTAGFFGWAATPATTRSWMGQHSSQASGQYWKIQSDVSAGNPIWSYTHGVTSGTSSLSVSSPYRIDTSHYEAVVLVVSGATSRLYVSGVLANSGALQFSPGPSGSSGILTDLIDVPFRLGAHRSFSSQGITNAVGTESGLMAEAFFMNRAMTEAEIVGYATSGFLQNINGTVTNSNTYDTNKDSIGAISPTSAPIIYMTAWDGNSLADPSGMRQISGVFHPAFIKLLGAGSSSGLLFINASRGTPSTTRAITIRNVTSGTRILNAKFWWDDASAFSAQTGYNISQHINSRWIPGLVLPSGSGVAGRSLGTASSVYRSDGNIRMSGALGQGTASSGEGDISQYIYLAFDSTNDLALGTYGYTGFVFRVSADFENV